MVILYIPGIPVNQVFPDGDLPGHPVMIGNKIIIPFARFPFGEVLKRLPAAEAGGRNAQRLLHGGDELILGKGSAVDLQGLRKICAGILDHQQRAGGSGALQRLALGDAEVGAVVCGDDDGRAVIKPQVLQPSRRTPERSADTLRHRAHFLRKGGGNAVHPFGELREGHS